jgi:predicted nucleic acid-binding protein
VIDTNVLAAALLKRAGHNGEVFLACLQDKWRPLIG